MKTVGHTEYILSVYSIANNKREFILKANLNPQFDYVWHDTELYYLSIIIRIDN